MVCSWVLAADILLEWRWVTTTRCFWCYHTIPKVLSITTLHSFWVPLPSLIQLGLHLLKLIVRDTISLRVKHCTNVSMKLAVVLWIYCTTNKVLLLYSRWRCLVCLIMILCTVYRCLLVRFRAFVARVAELFTTIDGMLRAVILRALKIRQSCYSLSTAIV